MIVKLPDPALSGETVRVQGVVPVLRGTPARVTRGGPVLCERNNEISGGLVGPARLRDLRKRAIV